MAVYPPQTRSTQYRAAGYRPTSTLLSPLPFTLLLLCNQSSPRFHGAPGEREMTAGDSSLAAFPLGR